MHDTTEVSGFVPEVVRLEPERTRMEIVERPRSHVSRRTERIARAFDNRHETTPSIKRAADRGREE